MICSPIWKADLECKTHRLGRHKQKHLQVSDRALKMKVSECLRILIRFGLLRRTRTRRQIQRREVRQTIVKYTLLFVMLTKGLQKEPLFFCPFGRTEFWRLRQRGKSRAYLLTFSPKQIAWPSLATIFTSEIEIDSPPADLIITGEVTALRLSASP